MARMTTPPAELKPRKKAKWYWHVVNMFFWLWLFGGLNVLLLQDIPLLLFLVGIWIALVCPMEQSVNYFFVLVRSCSSIVGSRCVGALSTLFVLPS